MHLFDISNILLILIFLPIFTLIVLLFVNDEKIIKNVTIFVTFFNFLLSLLLWVFFDKFTSKFQFFTTILWLPDFNINVSLGIDGISLFFIILTTL